jgi:hypothetical protein
MMASLYSCIRGCITFPPVVNFDTEVSAPRLLDLWDSSIWLAVETSL